MGWIIDKQEAKCFTVIMKNKGFAQIAILIGLVIMAVVAVLATRVVKMNVENRGQAADCVPAGGQETMGVGHLSCCKDTTKPVNCKNVGGWVKCDCVASNQSPIQTYSYTPAGGGGDEGGGGEIGRAHV